MDRQRLLLLLLPFASLFLILLVPVFVIRNPPSVRGRVPVLRLHHRKDLATCDGRWMFVQLLDDGTTKINEKQIRLEDLASLVQNFMEDKAERLIYVVPSPGIPYSRFIFLWQLKTRPFRAGMKALLRAPK
jgi:biopolymer transport protein ExbD